MCRLAVAAGHRLWPTISPHSRMVTCDSKTQATRERAASSLLPRPRRPHSLQCSRLRAAVSQSSMARPAPPARAWTGSRISSSMHRDGSTAAANRRTGSSRGARPSIRHRGLWRWWRRWICGRWRLWRGLCRRVPSLPIACWKSAQTIRPRRATHRRWPLLPLHYRMRCSRIVSTMASAEDAASPPGYLWFNHISCMTLRTSARASAGFTKPVHLYHPHGSHLGG